MNEKTQISKNHYENKGFTIKTHKKLLLDSIPYY